ncbi:acetyl-CoA synthetase-like protein [Auriculariales sp. MPI-PUGE-AT-0066]|nr:acetyl-CoA synthetase-like protein [Auriculariales sp. MPI-PUGE-AT-0066]
MAASPVPVRSISEAVDILTAPGAPYEVEQVIVDGRVTKSWKNLPSSLRSFWLETVRVYRNNRYTTYQGECFTYSQLHERASQLASVFRQQYHVRKGDRVAIAMRNCNEWVIAFWACHLLGAISVSVNGWLPAKPLMHCLTITSAKVIVVDPERAARIAPHLSELRAGAAILVASADGGRPTGRQPPRLHQGMALFDAVISQYHGPPEAWRKEPECAIDDDATIFFTSGTTGLPKGVLSSHRAWMHGFKTNNFSRDRLLVRLGLEPVPYPTPTDQNMTMAIGVPLMHVTGVGSAMMTATYMGYGFVMMRKWDKEAAAALFKQEGVHFFVGVPSMALDLFESSLMGDSKLLNVGYGGAPAASNIPALCKRAFPNALCSQGYGMTETNAGVINFGGIDYVENPKSTGWTAPTCDTIIVDLETNKIQPRNQVGELWVRGGSIMRGYWRNEEETNKALTKDGWMRTGDMAYIDDRGLVYIVDRAKDMIIRGGENIHSVNVENAIYADERIHDVAVAGVSHRRLGEIVGALVVPKAEHFGKITEEDVIALCKQALPHFAVPEVVVFQQDIISRNAAGKILKPVVRKTLNDEYTRRQRKPGSKGHGKVKAKL